MLCTGIENFHYNEGDLILIYYKMEEPLNKVAETADAVYDALKIIYPDATIIGLPENMISEITTISADDPLKPVLIKNYEMLRQQSKNTPTVKFDDADDDLWNI